MLDIDILEYLQFLMYKGIQPSEANINRAMTEIESLRDKIKDYEAEIEHYRAMLSTRLPRN